MKRATDTLKADADKLSISIHALMKRATKLKTKKQHRRNISIHALMKRATCPFYYETALTVYFNPRPHEEGDNGNLTLATFGCLFQSTPS